MLFECFDPGNNKQHSQYDLFHMNISPRNNDDEELAMECSTSLTYDYSK